MRSYGLWKQNDVRYTVTAVPHDSTIL